MLKHVSCVRSNITCNSQARTLLGHDVLSLEDELLKMNKKSRGDSWTPPSQGLVLIGSLSGGLTIALSVVYATLSSLAVYVRSNCEAGVTSQSGPGSSFFRTILLRLYFKQDDCRHSLDLQLDVTQESTVFLLICLLLSVSVLCFLFATFFIAALNSERATKFVEPMGYCYVTTIILSLAVDLALATHFGMDYDTFIQDMNASSPGVSVNYERDMYRLGSLLLMIVSLKGGVVPVLNIVLVSLVIFYLIEFKQKLRSEQHSMHKVGALRAFDHPRRMDEQSENSFTQVRLPKRNDDPWHVSESSLVPNRGYESNPTFDRSYGWHQSQPSVASRPFSYLEDVKRPPPPKSASPIREPQWQREPWDIPPPPVPAPDYSPDTPRRLKSALKSSYM